MQVNILQNAPLGAFCSTLTFIKLPFVIKIFVLSIFEWLLKAGFTVIELGHEILLFRPKIR